MDMDADEIKDMLASRLRFMETEERAEAACELYCMDIIDRKKVRELLGISEDEYLKRVMFGVWFQAIEERFESLSDEFLSQKINEQNHEYG